MPIGPMPAWPLLLVPTRNVWLVAWHVVGACRVKNITWDTPVAIHNYMELSTNLAVSYFIGRILSPGR